MFILFMLDLFFYQIAIRISILKWYSQLIMPTKQALNKLYTVKQTTHYTSGMFSCL